MIRTQDLVEFMNWELGHTPFEKGEKREMINEIVARLERYDEMKEGIEKLCRNLSSRVDKEE